MHLAVGQPAHPEGDRAGAVPARLDGEAHVTALLAHRPPVDQPRRRHEQRHRRVGDPEGRQLLELLGQREPELVARHHGVDALAGHEVLWSQDRRRVCDEGGPEGIDRRPRDRAARGGAVPAVAQQVLGARVEPAQQVEGRDRAPGAGPLVAVQREHHARAVMALGDPGGDDPDDPGVPALAGEHVGRLLAELAHLRLGLEEDARLGEAPLGVGVVELVGDRGGALGIVGEHELEPGVGAVQAPGGVDPRGQAKADRARVERPRVDLGHAQQRPDPGLGRRRQRVQALAHEAAVLVAQRDAVGHGGQGDEVQVLVGPRRIAPGARQQRGRELVGDAGGAQVGAWVAADGGMHDRGIGQRPVGARAVMVGDDDVQAEGTGLRDLVDRGDGAVGGEQQARAALGEPLHRRRAEPVAVLRAAGQVGVHVGSEDPQHAHEDGGRADAVDVVVAVDRRARARAHVREDQIDRGVDPGEGPEVMPLARRQPRARRLARPPARGGRGPARARSSPRACARARGPSRSVRVGCSRRRSTVEGR